MIMIVRVKRVLLKLQNSCLNKIKTQIRIIEWQNKPETYDVTDYFADGHTLHDFHGLIEAAPVFGGI